MQYFLYLRRSLTRAWREHLLLVLLVTCAMAFPICLSILDAGYVQGLVAQNFQWSRGHGAVVHNAEPGDEELFSSVKGAVPVWEEGRLWLDRTADNPIVYDENGEINLTDDFHMLPWRAVGQAGRTDLFIEFVEDPCRAVPEHEFSPGIRYTVFGFAAITMLTAYFSFWYNHTSDMQKLHQIGATNGQLACLRFVEMLIHQLAASGLSVLLSIVAVRVLTEKYIGLDMRGVDENVNTSIKWFVFAVPVGEILGVLCGLLAVSSLLFTIWHILYWLRHRCLTMASPLRPRIRLWAAVFPSWLLQHVFRRRSIWRVYLCTILIVPMLTCAILLLQLRKPAEEMRGEAPEYAISVMLNNASYAVWPDELTFLSELPGVDEVRCKFHPITRYILRDDTVEMTHGDYDVVIHGLQTKIYADESLELPEPEVRTDGAKIYSVAINNRENPIREYRVGDELEMTLPSDAGTIYLRVAAVLDPAEAAEREKGLPTVGRGDSLYQNTLHFRPVDFGEITQIQDVAGFFIRMKDLSRTQSVMDAVLDFFQGNSLLLVQNQYAEYEVAYNRAVGMNLLYTTLSLLLFAFFAIITTLSLIDYAASHRETIRLLHMQGASHRSIVAAFVEIMLPPGILTCAAVWAIVTPVEREYYRLRGYSDALMAKLGVRMIDDPWYLLAAVAVVAVFVAPVMGTVIRELRRLDRG